MARPPTNGSRPKSDSVADQRMKAAGIRAADAHVSVRRHANRLTAELDEVTPSIGVPLAELEDTDSMVVAVGEAIAVVAVARTASDDLAARAEAAIKK